MEILKEILTVTRPLLELLVTTVGPVLVGYIALRITKTLNITDDKQKAEFEGRLRDALHAAALNGLRYALQKAGQKLIDPGTGRVNKEVLTMAMDYVHEKNPETIKALKVKPQDIVDIILTKIPTINPTAPQPNIVRTP
jgi:hypothetical protein